MATGATTMMGARGLFVIVAWLVLVADLQAQTPQRIVSVIPAITEILFAIGAGPQVVGVGSYDNYPPGIGDLPRVGGLIDPDVEAIVELSCPDGKVQMLADAPVCGRAREGQASDEG